ncbi:MAG: GNAT family N-acetyltransferase [Chloroflexota bacterium]|nr:GNAT family N-acetyltransferase [Chloroflexota bacterium]MDQ5866060.1 GNAT family N-acetyltransferase [Chloroflexota bacterium]
MELRHYRTIEEFYRRAEPFLLEREAEHNLVLGICTLLMRYPERVEHPPYMACVEQAGNVVAVAFMGPPNNLILSHMTTTEVIPVIARDIYSEYKTLPGVISSVPFSKAFAEEWQRLSGQTYELSMAERIYRLERVKPVAKVPGRMRKAVEQDREVLRNWLPQFNEEALGETDPSIVDGIIDHFLDSGAQGLFIWEDGQPVSMAGYSRPTPNGVVIVLVYTPPEHRGKGYASACVATLSQMLLDQGRKYCFLYTDLANPTANHIYQVMGYEAVCDADVYRFENPA